jgi:hypothetical protein
MKKPAIVGQKTKILSWVPDGSPTPRLTGRLTVDRNLTSTSTTSTSTQGDRSKEQQRWRKLETISPTAGQLEE